MLLYKILPLWLWIKVSKCIEVVRSVSWFSIRVFYKNQKLPDDMYTSEKRDRFSKYSEPTITFENLSVIYQRYGRYVIRPIVAHRVNVDVIRIECENAAIKFSSPKGGSGGVTLFVTPVILYHEAFVLFSLIASTAFIMVIS